MKKKNVLVVGLSLLAIASLAACNTDTGSTATTNTGGDESSTSSTSQVGRRAEMTVEKTEIVAGQNFFDACKPTVIYYDENNEPFDYTTWVNYVRYTVTSEDGKTYTAGDALPAGRYTARASVKSRQSTVDFTVTNGNTVEGKEGDGYKSYTRDHFKGMTVTELDNVGALGPGKFPAIGTPKMLVVPVIFSDMKGHQDYTDEELDIVNRAFFGTSEETSWESLHSYYYKSSYGLLDIKGMVTDEFVTPLTQDGAEAYSSGAAGQIAQQAWTWAQQKYNLNPSDYDYNHDGYIDGINIIYKTTKANTSENPNANDLWWNYTSVTGAKPNVSNPVPYRYFWSEYDMINSGNYPGYPCIDAHTIIHENGHLMGLNDYYSYERTAQGMAVEGPAGCVDMMDNNVGDHNAYSKMMYGWFKEAAGEAGLNVMEIDGSNDNFTLDLNSFTDTGDVIIIRNTTDDKWNETPYDEYLILQYYTPTGVNESDSHGYKEWASLQSHGGTYANPGLQIFHVDNRLGARVGTYEKGSATVSYTGYEYVDTPSNVGVYNDDGTYVGPSLQLTSNTGWADNGARTSQHIDENGQLVSDSPYRELSAIFSDGNNGLDSTGYYDYFGETENLFGVQNEWAEENYITYGGSTFSNFKMRDFFANDLVWNDGSTFNWTFSVTDQDATHCTLHFVNNDAH